MELLSTSAIANFVEVFFFCRQGSPERECSAHLGLGMDGACDAGAKVSCEVRVLGEFHLSLMPSLTKQELAKWSRLTCARL